MRGVLAATIGIAAAQGSAVVAAPGKDAILPVVQKLSLGNPRSGSGIIVCSPTIGSGVTPADAAFGMGCSDWLYLYVGGQPQLGQTPLYEEINAAAREMKRDGESLRFAFPDARHLAQLTGAPAFVAATLEALDRTHFKLTYSLYGTDSGRLLATPYTLTGDKEHIRLGLPAVAFAISKTLGVAAPTIPPAVDASADELSAVGGLMWRPTTDSGLKTIQRLGGHVGTAGILLLGCATRWDHFLDTGFVGKPPTFVQASAQVLNKLAGNQLAWEIATSYNVNSMLRYRDKIRALHAKFPGSYPLAIADDHVEVRARDSRDALLDAAAAVHNAPRHSYSWLFLASSISGASETIRHSRVAADISAAEWARLNDLYAAWEYCDQKTVTLDPQSEQGWTDLAASATFAGDNRTAIAAYYKSEKYSPNPYRTYSWGLQMFQTKWGGDPATLAAVATRASNANYFYPQFGVSMMTQLRNAGFPDQAKHLGGRMLTYLDQLIRDNRGRQEVVYHSNKANVYDQLGDETRACAEWKTAVAIDPQAWETHEGYGVLLFRLRQYAAAIPEFRVVLQKQPRYADALYSLGVSLCFTDRYPEAEQCLLKNLAIVPNSPRTNLALGNLYLRMKQPQKALPQFTGLVRSTNADVYAYIGMTRSLSDLGRSKEAIQYGQRTLTIARQQPISPEYASVLHAAIGAAYGQLHQNATAVSELDLAISANPKNWSAFKTRGLAYNELGKRREARQDWQTVVNNDTDSQRASEARALMTRFAE